MNHAIICLLVSLCIFLVMITSANATPMEYVFTGQVNSINGSSEQAQVGSPVTLTVLIDFSRNPGVPGITDPTPNDYQIHYFYAELLSASPLITSLLNSSASIDQFNSSHTFAVNIPNGDPYGAKGALFNRPNSGADYGDSPFYLLSLNKTVSEWGVGDVFEGGQYGGVSNPSMRYQFTLTSVDAANPVPEPPTGLLVAGGAAVAGMRKRKTSPQK